MPNEIDVDTLRDWLTDHRAVTVLDIRPAEARAEWSIPGSVHVNAYDDLRQGRPGALAGAALPHDRPIVTVCNAGRVSQTAAGFLAQQGLDAYSLTGGMKAWSLAWNTAHIVLQDPEARVRQVRRTGKGCLSYLVVSDGEAAIIDPSLPEEVYSRLAREEGGRIRYVIETHIHADHLSRARQLAQSAGAALLLPDQQRVRFPFTPVRDADEVKVGQLKLTARWTPGHTPESTSYVLNGVLVFTGDTLFTKGVGRPDLHADPAAARQRARTLFGSLTALRSLGPDLLVLPAHASEPVAFDGRPVVARLADIDTWLGDWLSSEAAFVDRVTARLPDTPPNFGRIVALNESGELTSDDPTDLEAGANRCAVA